MKRFKTICPFDAVLFVSNIIIATYLCSVMSFWNAVIVYFLIGGTQILSALSNERKWRKEEYKNDLKKFERIYIK
jgi:D-alanyl-lipoteichoic acid acyltransferase DltB (MBOAT superfamily)